MADTKRRERPLNVFEKDRLHRVRESTKAAARESEERYLSALEAKRAGPRVMAAPPPLERQKERFGGGYRSKSSSYDWFYSLSRAEQARLRENWFSSSRSAESPDEIEERIPIKEWLDLTRRVDLSRAMATGKGTNASRFGGVHPKSLILDEPYDPEILHGDDEKAHKHIRQAHSEGRIGRRHRSEEDGPHVEFFTDAKGIVHPIRASYERRHSYSQGPKPPAWANDDDFWR